VEILISKKNIHRKTKFPLDEKGILNAKFS